MTILFGKKKEPLPTIYAEETCSSCGEKARRPFEEGDYVFRGGTPCKKCGSQSTTVSAIYGEYPPDAKNP